MTLLYTNDWTTGVDGAARIRVAQVVEAHEDELAACFVPDEGARIEVTFGWAAGKAVRIASDGTGAIAECVHREVASWRADVKAAGPFTWELVAVRAGRDLAPATAPPRLWGSLEGVSADGRWLTLRYTALPALFQIPFGEALRSQLLAIEACDLTGLPDGTLHWDPDSRRLEQLDGAEVQGAAATCLEAALRDLPTDDQSPALSIWVTSPRPDAPE